VTQQNLGRVIAWMVGALLSFSVLALSVRALAKVFDVFELLAIRTGFASVILIAIALLRPELRHCLYPRHMGAHTVRGAAHLAGQYGWTLAVLQLPLATVFALEFTSPAWLCLLASLFLGERLTFNRLLTIVLGFVGVLIVLRPGFEIVRPAAFLVLGAAFFFAVFNTITKKLTATEPVFAIVFWMNVLQFPMTLVFGNPLFFMQIGWPHLLPVLGIGIAGLSAHFCIAKAFQNGDATIVMPFDFLRIPLIAVVGWMFYGEALDVFVFIGAAVIVAGVAWNLRAEAKYRAPA
jgi:drug/metabolite transporter (DMT)-like permease